MSRGGGELRDVESMNDTRGSRRIKGLETDPTRRACRDADACAEIWADELLQWADDSNKQVASDLQNGARGGMDFNAMEVVRLIAQRVAKHRTESTNGLCKVHVATVQARNECCD